MSFQASFGALEDDGGSWLGFGILTFIWICSLVFCTTMIWNFGLYLDFEGAKTTHVLYVPVWDFGGCWNFLTEVWHIDLYLDMASWLWCTHVPNFDLLSWLWRCKEHPYPQSFHMGLWRILEVLDYDLVSWSWFGYGPWSLLQPWSKFWPSILILKVQRTSMSFKSSFGALEDAGGSWLGFGILILICIWSLVLDIPMIRILALYLNCEGVENIHVL